MTPAEVAQVERSYDRNLSWCRFWLGVSLAVATLTFTFAVNQVFDVPTERVGTPTDGSSDQSEPVSFSDIAIMLTLVGIVGVCVGLSALFQVFYRRDDNTLIAMEHPNTEATP